MKKTMQCVAATLVVLGAGGAQGAMRAIEQAYELTLAAITLPGNENGSLTVRRCAGCSPEILRVNAQTLYVLRPGRSPVSLSDLKSEASKVINRQKAAVYVYYDPRTSYVRRLVLDAAP